MPPDNLKEIVKAAKEDGDEKVWNKIDPDIRKDLGPHDRVRSFQIFTYALAICEDALRLKPKGDLHRLNTLFKVAKKMQIKGGQFHWFWKDRKKRRSRDRNAADFCLRGAGLLCLRHRETIKHHAPEAWETLYTLVRNATQASWQRHHPEKYGNMALMNALNLILLGETFSWPEVAREGYRRFDRICIYTYEWGIHEYSSPTYTAIQVNCLGLIERYCQRASARKQAHALLDFFWSHIGANWIRNMDRLGGAHSRQLANYLRGDGRIDETLHVFGWDIDLNNPPKRSLDLIYPALSRIRSRKNTKHNQRNDRLSKDLDRIRIDGNPPLGQSVTSSWGPKRNHAKKHYLRKNITLSTASSSYDYPSGQDMPLTADFIPSQEEIREKKETQHELSHSGSLTGFYPGRCYFVSDTENDPYGTDATHHAPLTWAGAQLAEYALGVALYDLEPRTYIGSHLVIPVDEKMHFLLPGKRKEIDIGELRKQNPSFQNIALDEVLGVRRENAAIYIRPVWTRNQKGCAAPIRFHFGKEYNTLLRRMRDAGISTRQRRKRKNPRTNQNQPRTQILIEGSDITIIRHKSSPPKKRRRRQSNRYEFYANYDYRYNDYGYDGYGYDYGYGGYGYGYGGYDYGYNSYDYGYGEYGYGYGYGGYDYGYNSYDYGYDNYQYEYGYGGYDYGYDSYNYGYGNYQYEYGYEGYNYEYRYSDARLPKRFRSDATVTIQIKPDGEIIINQTNTEKKKSPGVPKGAFPDNTQ